MLFMTVYIYNENTHGRWEWEEWRDKANQSTFITEETPMGGNSGRKEECLLKSWKNIECYYKTHTHGKQEWEEKKHERAPLWPWVSTWAPLLPWETMKRIVFIHIYTMMHPIRHGSYSVNLTVFGTERTSQCIRICKHWCHFNWKYTGTVYGNRHITFMGSIQGWYTEAKAVDTLKWITSIWGLYMEPKHTRPTHYINWQYTLTVYGDQRT